LESFEKASDFCLNTAKANCFLIDKDSPGDDAANIAELLISNFFIMCDHARPYLTECIGCMTHICWTSVSMRVNARVEISKS
jgi:hypothetical protein